MLLPLLRGVLVGVLAFVSIQLPAAAACLAPSSPAFRSDETERIRKLVEEIESGKGMHGGRLFRELSAFKSLESFEAMKRVTKSLRQEQQLEPAYAAFENYLGVDGLEEKAIEWVSGRAIKGGESERRAAARGLARFGRAAESELRMLLSRSKDEVVRAWAVGPLVPTLAAEGTPGALGLILENARPGPSGSREELSEALEKFTGDANDQALFGFLRGRDSAPALVVMAIEVLAQRQDDGVARALVAALKHDDASVQLAALAALDERRETLHGSVLEKLLEDDDELVRRQAVISLARLRAADEGLIDLLRDLARERDPATRQGAVVALAELRTPEALEALYLLLADEDHLVRREALQQVGNLRRRETLPALIGRLNGETGRLKLDLLTTLRLYLRLAYQWRWLDSGQYEHVSKMVEEIGRLLGGWLKQSSGSADKPL